MRFISKGALGGVLVAMLAIGAVMAPGAFASTTKGELVNSKGGTLVKNKASMQADSLPGLEVTGGSLWKCESTNGTLTMTSKTAGTLNESLNGCQTFNGKCHKAIELNSLEVAVERNVAKTEDLLLIKIPAGKVIEFECAEVKHKLKGEFLSTAGPGNKLTKSLDVSAPGTSGNDSITKYVNTSGEEETVAAPLEMGNYAGVYEDVRIPSIFDYTFEEEVELI